MFHSPWFRRILCVILAVIFCCSAVLRPLEARAVDPVTAKLVYVAVSVAIPAIMIGLGLMPGSNSDAFHSLASSIASKLDVAWTFTSAAGVQMINMICLKNNYFAQRELLQHVLDLIITSSDLEKSYLNSAKSDSFDYASLPSSVDSALASCFSSGSIYGYYGSFSYSPDTIHIFCSRTPCVFVDNSTLFKFDNSFFSIDLTTGQISGCSGGYQYIYSSFILAGTYVSSTFAIGNLAESLDDDKYKTWVQDPIISINFGVGFEDNPGGSDDDNDKFFYDPTWIPRNPSEFPGVDQNKVQEGGPSEIDPEYIEITDTKIELDQDSVPEDLKDPTPDPDPDSGNGDGGGSGTTTNPGSPTSGSFNNSSEVDPGKFKFDFKKLFPFCIPFDLYAMLNALQAEPITPTFTLGIPFLGKVYTFQVDLSPWNDIASILRTCQVAIFCIGLTQATRKYIKW